MHQHIWGTCSLLALLATASASWAVVVSVKNLSTGIDDATTLRLTNNQPDSDYVIAAGGTGGHVGEVPVARATPLPNGWLADSASAASRWIVLNTGVGQEGVNVGPGTYLMQTSVNLSGVDPATAVIASLRYAADNKLLSLRVNGSAVFSQNSTFAEEFGNFISLPSNLGGGLFHDGANTITFELMNQEGVVTPLGLRVEGSVAAQVPEPGAFAAACVTVMVGLGATRRRSCRV
jgi:hypothetical protein